MSNNKQSSVEYYINNLIEILGDEICNNLTIEQTNRIHFLGQQAKAMHKEEIGDAYFLGYGDHQTLDWHDLDEYYNETFSQ